MKLSRLWTIGYKMLPLFCLVDGLNHIFPLYFFILFLFFFFLHFYLPLFSQASHQPCPKSPGHALQRTDENLDLGGGLNQDPHRDAKIPEPMNSPGWMGPQKIESTLLWEKGT